MNFHSMRHDRSGRPPTAAAAAADYDSQEQIAVYKFEYAQKSTLFEEIVEAISNLSKANNRRHE